MKNILILMILVSLMSCQRDSINSLNKKDSISLKAFPNDSIIISLQKSLITGDTSSYKALYREFAIKGQKKDFLYYSMKMGELHNYGQAFFDVSTILTEYNYKNNLPLDDKLVLYYRLKAYEVGNKNAKGVIQEIFVDKGLAVPKSSSILSK